MSRLKNQFAYNDPLPRRLRELVEQNGITFESLADAIGTTRQTVGNWLTGKTVPDASSLCKIAKFFGVSCDWLLGLTDTKKFNMSVRGASEVTRLSPKAVEILHSEDGWTKQGKAILSDMIENGTLLEVVRRIRAHKEHTKISISCSDPCEKTHALEMVDVSEYMARKALLLYMEDIKERIYNGTLNF